MAEYRAQGIARPGARDAVRLRGGGADGERRRRRRIRAARARPGSVPRARREIRRRGLHARVRAPDRREPRRVSRLRTAGVAAERMSEAAVPQPEDIYERTKEE